MTERPSNHERTNDVARTRPQPQGNPSPSPEWQRPVHLHLDKREGLRIEWADGHLSHYPLPYLRKHCPCAGCRKAREEQSHQPTTSLTVLPPNSDEAAQFTDAWTVGNYAIQVKWADGHQTGIYDFRYLRTICPCGRPDGDTPVT